MTLYTEGFSRFVTSTAASIATGWSNSCRVGSRPLRDRAFFQAHQIISPRLHHSPALRQEFRIVVGGANCIAFRVRQLPLDRVAIPLRIPTKVITDSMPS